MERPIRIVGRRTRPATVEERLWANWKLEKEVDLLHPWPKPRGFVFKAKTWEEYAAWRAAQENPRLW